MRGFRLLRRNHKTNMQKDFIFVDTEAYRHITPKEETQTLRLGVLKTWNRLSDQTSTQTFFTPKEFWDHVETYITHLKQVIIFAHNFDYDFKILNGLTELNKRGWEIKQFWIKSPIFSMMFEKNGKQIFLWDTTNYIHAPLSKLGEAIGLEKQEVNFDDVTEKELIKYCKNDVEILYRFVQYLVNFLMKYRLSKLRPTAASLAFNVFRHRFYKRTIYIHDWKKACELERLSYRGGLCDCLKVGTFKGERIYKLDVNSMYPNIMSTLPLPVKLLLWTSEAHHNQKKLNEILNENLNDLERDIIAYVRVYLPKGKEWILKRLKIDGQMKTARIGGFFSAALTTPELAYIRDHGRIINIQQIAVYEKDIFLKQYVQYFYHQRQKFDNIFSLFCKMLLNTVYGKFAQKHCEFKKFGESTEENIKSLTLITDEGNKTLMQVGKQVFEVSETDDPSTYTFTAISSLITAHARAYLIDLINKAGSKEVYYCDTDSLFVTPKGYQRLKKLKLIGNELGQLKLEGTARTATFYRPKFYEFGKEFICKGLKKDACIIKDDEGSIIAEQSTWVRMRGALRNNETNHQTIHTIHKEFQKEYNKGSVLRNGNVEPFFFETPNDMDHNS